MEASIKANRITEFVRLLQCASKFGDDLNISANKDLWELAVTNSSKSAFCLFKLHKAFFCRFKASGTTVEQRRGVKCQLLVKSLLAVLGKTSAAGNVERVDLKIHDPDHSLGGRRRRGRRDAAESGGPATDEEESDDDVGNSIESMLIMKLVCKHGVIKRHSLHLGQTEFLRADVDPDTTPSGFLIDARTLRDWLDHFHIGLTSSHVTTSAGTTTIRQENQLSWLFSRDEVRVKSWEGGTRELSTEIKVDPGEFLDYEIFTGRVDLTLPMREFRATLALADQLSIRLVAAFSEAGQPFTLTSEVFEDGDPIPYEIFCAIATTTCDQFVTVKTPSDPPSVNGGDRSRSRSSTSFLNRNGTGGSRDGSMNGRARQASGAAADDATTDHAADDGDEDRHVRRRVHSERPPSARPRLSMSDRPIHISNSIPTDPSRAATISAAGAVTSEGDSNTTSHDTNALFLPGGSQVELDDTGAGPSTTRTQTQSRLTQREVEELTGLENLDEVLEAMDDEQHEEELEEMRASQREAPQEREEEGDYADADHPQSQSERQSLPGPPLSGRHRSRAPLRGMHPTTSQRDGRPPQSRSPLGDITLEIDDTIFGLGDQTRISDDEQPEGDTANNDVDTAMEPVEAERELSPEITVEPAPFDIHDPELGLEEAEDEDMPIAPGNDVDVEAEDEAEVEAPPGDGEEEVVEDKQEADGEEEFMSPTQPLAEQVNRSERLHRTFQTLFED